MKKKNTILFYPFAIMVVFLMLSNSCKKDDTTNKSSVPVLKTTALSDITSSTASCGGNITSDGVSPVTAYGVCWSADTTPTIADSKTTDGTGTGSFTSAITGLNANTTYYVRAYATNNAGTGYGSVISFTTQSSSGSIPILTTSVVSSITSTTASSGGNISSDGGSAVITRGVCWSAGTTPTITDSKTIDGIGAGTFTSSLNGLSSGISGTTYFVRAYATTSYGTGYGNALSFTTLPAQLPVLTTSDVSDITQTTATCGGNITSDGGSTITIRGICWSTITTPTIADSKTANGTGIGNFTNTITGLSLNTIYYLRSYATNIVGTSYGNQMVFKTYTGSITDIDGNVYHTVTIGTQEWMVENLKITKYRNGDPIPNVTDNFAWSKLITGAYCDYDNTQSNSTTYGKLYNWYTVNDSRNIAPIGWHIPSDAEWTILTDYLLGEWCAGGKLKETGTTHWNDPNTGATNETGFTALPGGYRVPNGIFDYTGHTGRWWSSTGGVSRVLFFNVSSVLWDGASLGNGYSVRCLRDI